MADGEERKGAEPPKLEEHEATFNAFLKWASVVAVITVLILIFLAIVGT
ncbi:MAG: aa3-type cytochrome c oxidase subunit IV [Pseudomonadota bacterium]